jgi:hypothetical protein
MSAREQIREQARARLDAMLSMGTFATGRKEDKAYLGAHIDKPEAVMQGVTVGWLAQVFNFNHDQVKKKLANCPPLYRRKEGFIYDIKVATQYLVKPAFNIEEWLKNAKIEDLPIRLQTEFWNARNKRREYEIASGELWKTEDVFRVLSEIMQATKHAVQSWSANVERTAGLSEAQFKILQGMIDGLQNDLHQRIVKLASDPKTASVLARDREEERRAEEEARRAEEQTAREEWLVEGDDEEEEFDVSTII